VPPRSAGILPAYVPGRRSQDQGTSPYTGRRVATRRSAGRPDMAV